MTEWWNELESLTRFFYGMAAFFSVFFIWQIVAAFLGMTGDDLDLGGGEDLDVDFNADAPDEIDYQDVVESSQAFKVLSLRSIVTFFTLFSWMGALHLDKGTELGSALLIATIWGAVGMFVVAFIFYAMNNLTESGTKDAATAAGRIGTVYLDIPAEGFGEVKVDISGALEHIRAKSVEGVALSAGTEVRVVQVMSQTLVGVVENKAKGE